MENAVNELEVLDEEAENTDKVSGCCSGGTATARN